MSDCPTCNNTGFVNKTVRDFELDNKMKTGLPQDAIMQLACPDCQQSYTSDMTEVRSGVSGMGADQSTDSVGGGIR